jgi:hypothetical protein
VAAMRAAVYAGGRSFECNITRRPTRWLIPYQWP